jgi:1-deoxy-D-xylulose-5-phosphate synthase
MRIEDIKSPDFLKNLKDKELQVLSDDIRKYILEKVSQTGGHLSSNLGIVELTIALHYVFNSPKDKFLFDVGHQSYVHKILTGRAQGFDKLRQKDGLSGFIKYSESPHDVWEAGHSSTSLSAAAGFLEARSGGADIGEVITIVGDGSIQNGLSFEGLNYLGTQKNQKSIIIINDNDMSISKNVGRLAKSMSKIRIKRSYSFFKKITPKLLQQIFRRFKNGMKSYVYQNNIFSSLGYKYYGPINGHNIKELIQYLKFAKQTKYSVILHVKTIKGKGYDLSENDEIGSWHGVTPFDLNSGKSLKDKNLIEVAWGKGICNSLMNIAKANNKIRVITPAMIGGSNLIDFQKQYPDLLIDVGIAEEHAVVMAAGLARCGMIPIVSIYSTFLQRAYDQISHDVCRSNNHVIFLIDRAGIIGGDGSTHQGIFDVAFLSHLPNMVITMPKDLNEANNLLRFAINYQGPIVMRYPKSNTLIMDYTDEDIVLGSWVEELEIQDINIITYGESVNKFKKELMGRGVGLINARFIKPLDLKVLAKLSNKRVLIVEEVIRNGSLASLILDANLRNEFNLKIESYAIDDVYIDCGTADGLRKELEIDVDSILNKI